MRPQAARASAKETAIRTANKRLFFISKYSLQNESLNATGDLETGKMRYGSIVEETRTILNNLSTLLRRYGSDLDHVVQATVLTAVGGGCAPASGRGGTVFAAAGGEGKRQGNCNQDSKQAG